MTIDLSQPITREDCLAADATDPLAHFKDRFDLPQGVIYLDGNSLGARPKGAAERAEEVIKEEWGNDLITSWNTHNWFELPTILGDKISRLIGGDGGECVVTDTTRSEEHTSELQSRGHLVCRLLLEKKKQT